MKKIFALLLLAATALTGCIKEDNSYKKWLPYQNGMAIYNAATAQNGVAFEPAAIAMRLGLLIGEAAKQKDADTEWADVKLDEVTITSGSTTINVKNALFGSATIARQSNGNYLITFAEGVQFPDGYYLSGSVTVLTGGVETLDQATLANPWTVTMTDLTVGSSTSTIQMNSGATTIYNYDGTYNVTATAMNANFKSSSSVSSTVYKSSWSGTFLVKPAVETLAYSECKGKDFVVSGNAGGATIYTFNNASSSSLSYVVEDATYYSSLLIDGKQTCSLVDGYDLSTFLTSESRRVVYEWDYTSASGVINYTINYNGNTMTQEYGTLRR